MSATHKIVNGEYILLTPEEKAVVEAEWAANPFSLTHRRPRLPEDVVDALNALTTAQKNAIWNDITAGGANAKWKIHRGPHASLICTQHLLASSTTATAAEIVQAKIHGIAYYCLDSPNYLINPAFDPSINIPGNEPIG